MEKKYAYQILHMYRNSTSMYCMDGIISLQPCMSAVIGIFTDAGKYLCRIYGQLSVLDVLLVSGIGFRIFFF